MIKIKRYFNKNIRKIIIFFTVIIVVIIIIQVLNGLAKKDNNTELNNVISENITSKVQRDTVITEGKVEKEKNDQISYVINNFISKCNEKKLEDAYNMLSNDCKEQMYPNINIFKNSYYDTIFSVTREVGIESWITKNGIYTYKVTLTGNSINLANILQTEDYYSIVKENDEIKLNINSFIGKKDINKEKETDTLKIKLNKVYIYMDYETYDMDVYNKKNESIKLDTKSKSDTMFVEDNKNNKYFSKNYELSDFDLNVNSKSNKNIKITYTKSYNSKLDTKKIVFYDIKYSANKESEKIEINI